MFCPGSTGSSLLRSSVDDVHDAATWERGRALYDIGDILAFEDRGSYLYVAGDATRAYSPDKLDYFTRQIVFLRPDTFVIFDRVKSTNSSFRKSWVLQAMEPPTGEAPNLMVTNGKGRLFVQTVLPVNPQVSLAAGSELYTYGGRSYPPGRDTGPAPECRVEISPASPAKEDFFLHVLTATEATVTSVPQATAQVTDTGISVAIGETKISFAKGEVAMRVEAATAVEEAYAQAWPRTLSLEPNYPNPFNHSTVIQFSLPEKAEVELSLYNLMGQKVATLLDGVREAGMYSVRWDGRDDGGREVAGGTYQYRLRAGMQVEMRKLLLLR